MERTGSDRIVEPIYEDPDLELEDELLEDEEETAQDQELYEHFSFTADRGQRPLRVDRFLVNVMPHVSRNRIQQSASAGSIHVNGVPVKSNYKVKPLDEVSLRLAHPPYESEIVPEDIPLNIVYEDSDLLVVNKPAGMVVHPGHGNYRGTLVNALAYYLRDTPGYDINDPRLGLVHRIDKDTSGLLVIAKNVEVRAAIGKQFFDHTTRRRYRALIWGRPKEPEGTIRSNIGRDPRNRLRMANLPYLGEEGKPAVTHYKVIEELGYVSLIECQLETGRTHQIRVHMMGEGHPIFNDERYGGDQILRGNRFASYRRFIENCFELCPRQALHALSLGFYHPTRHEEMDFESELPSDMAQLLEKWRVYVQAGSVEPLDE